MANGSLILPLETADPPLALVGGKTRGLAMLIQADLPVPRGFCITTLAFDRFAAGLRLEPAQLQAAGDSNVAADLRQRITSAAMPEDLAAAISTAYSALCSAADPEAEPSVQLAVAVRSSATAEDLPGLSFAGQQASFLNVVGVNALLDATKACWASLYTDRAVSYRQRAGISQDTVTMAVVIQQMLPADAAGVLFTANPTTGARDEILINSSLGLGEAVVSGTITPDAWVLDRDDLSVKEAAIGSKATRIDVSGDAGTETRPVPDAERNQPTLTDPDLQSLARLGIAAEVAADGTPQDIEWVISAGTYHLVQSRPITNLPPPMIDAEWLPPPGVERLFRRQVVENMSAPLSPLFEELYLNEGLDRGMDQLMESIQLPMSMDDVIHRPMFMTVNGYGYLRYDIKFGWHFLPLIPKTLYYYVTKIPGVIRTVVSRWEDGGLPAYQQVIDEWRSIDADTTDSQTLISGIRILAHADATYWGHITMMMGAAKVSEGMLAWFLNSRLVPGTLNSGAFLRGFPSKTLAAQESLASLAAGTSPELRDRILSVPATELMTVLRNDDEAIALRASLQSHLEIYGQQIFDLDFVTPTQAEQPEVVFASLQRLLNRDASALPPSAQTLAAERDALIEEVITSLGPTRRWIFRKLLNWAQTYGPYREAALFYMGAAWPTLRKLALTLGDRLAAIGALETPEDVFFLTTTELTEVCESKAGLCAAAAAAAAERRSVLRREASDRVALREARKRLHPPARVPVDLRFMVGPFDLTRFFETWETQKHNAEDASLLTGFAVSPGRVTGVACVVRSAADFHKMHAGAVLVCPTTTPAWTPLFDDAVGLVTDIGAVLAHGSIVAREYGIPAVMGTGNGTERITDGDLITVDGDRGQVSLTNAD